MVTNVSGESRACFLVAVLGIDSWICQQLSPAVLTNCSASRAEKRAECRLSLGQAEFCSRCNRQLIPVNTRRIITSSIKVRLMKWHIHFRLSSFIPPVLVKKNFFSIFSLAFENLPFLLLLVQFKVTANALWHTWKGVTFLKTAKYSHWLFTSL